MLSEHPAYPSTELNFLSEDKYFSFIGTRYNRCQASYSRKTADSNLSDRVVVFLVIPLTLYVLFIEKSSQVINERNDVLICVISLLENKLSLLRYDALVKQIGSLIELIIINICALLCNYITLIYAIFRRKYFYYLNVYDAFK